MVQIPNKLQTKKASLWTDEPLYRNLSADGLLSKFAQMDFTQKQILRRTLFGLKNNGIGLAYSNV